MTSGIRDRALLLLGFNLMARRSELAGLDLVDIRDAGAEGIEVFIRRSKTDQSAEGTAVPVPFGQHAETSAVRAVRAWQAVMLEYGFSAGALFRPVDRHHHIGDEPGAAGNPRPRLTPLAVNEIVRSRVRLAQLPERRRLWRAFAAQRRGDDRVRAWRASVGDRLAWPLVGEIPGGARVHPRRR